MLDIWDGSYNFQDTAKYHGYTPEELGVAFAVFGVQAMEIMQQRSVYKDTAFRAMALNKDGYSTKIEHTLPKALRQKKAEVEAGGRGALFRKLQGLKFVGKGMPYHSTGKTLTGQKQSMSGEKMPLPKLPDNKY